MSTQWIGREAKGQGELGGGKKIGRGTRRKGEPKQRRKKGKGKKKSSGHHTYGNRVTFWLLEAVRLWG